MGKYLVVCFYLLAHSTCTAQFRLHGIVLDSITKSPVPYSLIVTNNGNLGTITDGKGEFELNIPDSLKSGYLYISCIGYDTTTVRLKASSDPTQKTFLITRKSILLPAVNIAGNTGSKVCSDSWGAKSNHSFGGYPCVAGDEVAVFIANSKQDSGIISTLKFFITDEGFPTTRFRAKLYRVNPKNNAPGELMNDQDFILSAKKGNEWAVIDISKYDIPIPKEGFFVSMEWLPDSKNSTYKPSFNVNIEKNGQTLGTNREIKHNVTWIKTFLHNWGDQSGNEPFNAMIGAGVLINCK